jgi:hypothetical protein
MMMADTPRGIRNNNPGNIERTGDRWQGMSADQSGDARFVVFDAPVWGLRALARILRKDMAEGDTLRRIIGEWAPAAENNTGAYVNAVARHVGMDPDAPVREADLPRLMAAIVQHENGAQPYPPELFAQALALERGAPQQPQQPVAAKEETMAPLAPLIVPLASAVIDVFTPLAKEKITKEMGRHTDNPQVAAQIADGVIETAKVLTGRTDPIAAVAAVKADPALVRQVEASALDNLDRMAPMLDRLAQWDQQAAAAQEQSRDAARKYNDDEPLFLDTAWLKLKFIHVLSLVFVGFSGIFVTQNWGSLTSELKGAVITLMVIAGWTGVREYWMGSSRSSSAKDVVIGELSRRK